MEVLDWEDVQLEPAERKTIWIAALDKLSRSNPPVRRVIIAMEHKRGELPVQELLMLRFQGLIVEDDTTLRERIYGKIQLDGLRPSNFLYSDGFRLHASQQFTRQVVSIVAAAFGLLLFLPFFPLVVLAVKLSSRGPVFFRPTARRHGRERVFDVPKFRTMFTDAEAGGAKWATKNDPRVTMGQACFCARRASTKIPQLWNVLRGDIGICWPTAGAAVQGHRSG